MICCEAVEDFANGATGSLSGVVATGVRAKRGWDAYERHGLVLFLVGVLEAGFIGYWTPWISCPVSNE
jgi:hypothetical protein